MPCVGPASRCRAAAAPRRLRALRPLAGGGRPDRAMRWTHQRRKRCGPCPASRAGGRAVPARRERALSSRVRALECRVVLCPASRGGDGTATRAVWPGRPRRAARGGPAARALRRALCHARPPPRPQRPPGPADAGPSGHRGPILPEPPPVRVRLWPVPRVAARQGGWRWGWRPWHPRDRAARVSAVPEHASGERTWPPRPRSCRRPRRGAGRGCRRCRRCRRRRATTPVPVGRRNTAGRCGGR